MKLLHETLHGVISIMDDPQWLSQQIKGQSIICPLNQAVEILIFFF